MAKMLWPKEQRAFAVEAYFSKGRSIVAVQRAFRLRFEIPPRGHVPGRKSILLWVKAFRETGNVSKKKKGPPRTVTTPENVERVRLSIQRSPKRSARKHAVALGISERSLRRILHDEPHLHSYKKVVVQQLCMSSTKIAVVTGGNKGIGYAIVKGLCEKFDGTVYLTARDKSRGKAAVAKLNKLGLKPAFHLLDVENEESVTIFKDYIVEKYGGIDVLVNNAAMAFKHDATEPVGEQAEVTVRVNFTSLLNTCHILFPILRPGARVVNLSSVCGHLHQINGKEPHAKRIRERFSKPELTEEELCHLMEEFVKAAKDGDHFAKGWPNSTYVVSKVGVSALTRIQQRAFDADTSRPGIVVNAVHPGYVDTDMTSHKGPLTIEEGAVAPLFLALLPPNNADTPKGAYVWKDKTVLDWEKRLPSQYVV